MSARQVSCPKCAIKLSIPATTAANATLRCSSCKSPFRVPSAPVYAKPMPKAPNTTCPHCRKQLHVAATVAANTAIKCPHCTGTFRTPAQPITAGIQVVGATPGKTGVTQKLTQGVRQVLHSDAAQKLTATAKRQWQNPKRRPWILGIGVGGTALAAMLVLGFVLTVGWWLFGGRGQQVAQGDTRPAEVDQQQPRKVTGKVDSKKPVLSDSLAPKKGIIKQVKAGTTPAPNPLDPKNRPWLVLEAGGHSSRISRLMFTPDRKNLISVSDDKTIRVWDVETGETERVIRVPIDKERVGSLFAGTLSPDGKMLAVGGMHTEFGQLAHPVYLVSLKTDQITRVLTGHTNVLSSLHFSSDGRKLVSASNDTTARIWDVATGQTLKVLRGHTKLIRCARFSPSGKQVATVARDGTIRIWSTQSGQTEAICRPASGNLECVTWHPNGRLLAGGTDDGYLYLWDQNGRQQRRFKLHPFERLDFNYMTWSKHPSEILYAGVGFGIGADRGRFGGRVGIFNIASGRTRIGMPKHRDVVQYAAMTNDGELAASTGGIDNAIFIWRTSNGQVVHELKGKAQAVINVGWTMDGQLAWTNTPGGYFPKKGQFPRLRQTFDLSKFTRDVIKPGQQTVSEVLSKDGWSLRQPNPQHIEIRRFGRVVDNFRTPVERMIAFTVLPNNRAAIGMDRSANILVIGLDNRKKPVSLRGHTGMVRGLAASPDGRYLASCSNDGTICIWSLANYKLLMKLFLAEREWIIWTPEGYYASSVFGERLMGWHINNGPDKTASFHPAVRFRDSLYKPEAIKRLLTAGNIKQALQQTGGQQQGEPVQLVQVLPPHVAITSPTRGRSHSTAQETLTITASAQSVGQHPVTSMKLLLDGRPYQGDQGHLVLANPRLGQVEASWNVKLPPGEHIVAVQAESKVSKAVSQQLEVTRTSGTVERPNLYVLAIGISEYPGQLRLRYAHKDAIAIRDVFQETTKPLFQNIETKLIIDRNATRDNIYQGLAWLKAKMTTKDVGVIFFAGHGARDRRGNFYLVPVDIRPGPIESSCISGDRFKRALANIPGRLVAMFDACHSGSAAKDKDNRNVSVVADNLARDLVTEDYGIVVMCSSLGTEYSMESSSVGHGFFTLGIIEGLAGRADFNNDNQIFLHEMDRYASSRVQGLSRGRQNPVTARPPTVRSFPLSRP